MSSTETTPTRECGTPDCAVPATRYWHDAGPFGAGTFWGCDEHAPNDSTPLSPGRQKVHSAADASGDLFRPGDAIEPQPFTMPDRIAIDAKGYGWRVWDDEDFWSMVPVNPDNSPIPYPVTWFVPDGPLDSAVLGEQLATATGLLDQLINWFGAPDWEGPQVPIDLARRIAAFFADQADA